MEDKEKLTSSCQIFRLEFWRNQSRNVGNNDQKMYLLHGAWAKSTRGAWVVKLDHREDQNSHG